MNVLEINALTKRFGKYTALDSVSFSLERGRIYGFVGNNGAGKTTLMRIICGLSRPTSGSFSIFGAESEKDLQLARRRVGSLIESPVFYPDMTARQNLIAQSIICGVKGTKRVDELMQIVGLGGKSAKKSIKHFSTGMKQRYGLAFALIGSPELLILDEPLNGLDVEGMDDITELLLSLCNEHGVTILLSSHLLARLDKVATNYIFIDYGKIVEQISAEELRTKVEFSELENYFRNLVRHDVLGLGDK